MAGKDKGKWDKCTNCGKDIWLSEYAMLCDIIMKSKPICSYECNKALGQVK